MGIRSPIADAVTVVAKPTFVPLIIVVIIGLIIFGVVLIVPSPFAFGFFARSVFVAKGSCRGVVDHSRSTPLFDPAAAGRWSIANGQQQPGVVTPAGR